ncbi:short-chain dehydrogenase/reductase [Rhodococcus sp. HNM0569]|uniref:short-chain dehydrogenase/reductase n=1 Tax=Rhodococcus sp. HNM0569 TaxID=2716340 RepID=UPI00146E994E|nr:short-chain dehydrogenase/reductase [Rhodococcus sp. HNM0569]NLU83677.1 SDR family NAD(P)-dependent oxidoreductase [Rhodococcus sp. HNM0569]
MSRRWPVAGSVVLVTGAAQGVGRALAHELHARGARLVLTDLDDDGLAAVAAELRGDALTVPADVRDRDAMASVVDRALARFGRLDGIVANAGITPPPATIRRIDPADFDRVIDVNLTGVLNTVHPGLDEVIRNRGHVVVVASAAAFCPGMGGSAYMASKAAAEQFGRALALELAPYGASAGVAYFGFVDTALARATLDLDPLGARVGALLPWPFARRVSAEHAARVVVRGLDRRAARTVTPRVWWGYSLARGILNPVIDAVVRRRRSVLTLVRDLDARSAAAKPGSHEQESA